MKKQTDTVKKDKQLLRKERKNIDKIDRIDIEVTRRDSFDKYYNKDINVEEGTNINNRFRSSASCYPRARRFSNELHYSGCIR